MAGKRNPSEPSPPPSGALSQRMTVTIIVILALLAVILTPIVQLHMYLFLPAQPTRQSGAGPFDRPAHVALIEKAISLHLPHDQYVILRWNDLRHPESLHVISTDDWSDNNYPYMEPVPIWAI